MRSDARSALPAPEPEDEATLAPEFRRMRAGGFPHDLDGRGIAARREFADAHDAAVFLSRDRAIEAWPRECGLGGKRLSRPAIRFLRGDHARSGRGTDSGRGKFQASRKNPPRREPGGSRWFHAGAWAERVNIGDARCHGLFRGIPIGEATAHGGGTPRFRQLSAGDPRVVASHHATLVLSARLRLPGSGRRRERPDYSQVTRPGRAAGELTRTVAPGRSDTRSASSSIKLC